jgi:hypothetical protein
VIAEGEGNEERPSRLVLSNRDESLFGSGVLHVGRHFWSCHECRFNIRQRHAVFPALANIAVVPLEACDLPGRQSQYTFVYTNVNFLADRLEQEAAWGVTSL